jgi:hypothetical protein
MASKPTIPGVYLVDDQDPSFTYPYSAQDYAPTKEFAQAESERLQKTVIFIPKGNGSQRTYRNGKRV